ncbi:MAG: hypothetical protein HZA48_01930, partial [Planctomycetes bacterium]|nr:hypothetical protein [Planctomycetota bacterium]
MNMKMGGWHNLRIIKMLCVKWLLGFLCVLFMSPFLLADDGSKHDEKIKFSSVSVSPEFFSPSQTSCVFSSSYIIKSSDGLKQDDKSPEHKFFVKQTIKISSPSDGGGQAGAVVNNISTEQELVPPVKDKSFSVTLTAQWDGKNDAGVLLADGSYIYNISAQLVRTKSGENKKGDGKDKSQEKDKDKDEDKTKIIGETSAKSGTIVLDNTLPVITVSPSNNELVTSLTPVIQVTYSDATSGIDTLTFHLSLDGQDVTGGSIITPIGATYTVDTHLTGGAHTIITLISDKAANASEVTSTFLIDSTPPVLSLQVEGEVIANGSVITNFTPQFQIDYTDDASGVNTVSFKWFLDGADITGDATITSSNATYAPSNPLYGGQHSISSEISDNAGNKAEISANFIIADAGGIIDSAGGTITVTNSVSSILGASLTVPPNAVSSPVTLYILSSLPLTPFPSYLVVPVGPAVEFGPSGTAFAVPPVISMPYQTAMLPANMPESAIHLYYYNPVTQLWEKLSNTSLDTVNKLVIAETPHFSLYQAGAGIVDPVLTTVTADPQFVVANNASKSIITVAPKDADGNPLGSGQNVALSQSGPGTLGAVTDKGDGTYTADLTATFTTGITLINATVNGIAINQQAQVTFSEQDFTNTVSKDENGQSVTISGPYTYNVNEPYSIRLYGVITGWPSYGIYQWYFYEDGQLVERSGFSWGTFLSKDFTFTHSTIEPHVYRFGFRRATGHNTPPYAEVGITLPQTGGAPSEANSPFVVCPLNVVDCDASNMSVMDGIAYMPNSANVELGASQLNLADGSLSVVQPIAVSRGTGFTANIALIYNSLSYYDGPNGFGWRHNLDMRIYPRGASYIFVNETGLPVRFTLQSGVYRSDPRFGEPATTLTINPDSTYTIVRKSNVVMQFDVSGRLTSIYDTKGNTLTLVYSGTLLTTVIDSAGRTTSLDYTNNKLTGVTMPGGAVTTLEYSGKYLTAIHLPTGEIIRYEYNPTSELLVKKTDPAGYVYEYSYGKWGKLVNVKYPNNGQKTVNYNEAGSTVAITDAITGVHTYTYNALLNAITQYTDPANNTITSNWDASRNNTGYQNPKSGSFSATYWPNGSPKTMTNAMGYMSYFEYDGANNLTRCVGPVKDLNNDGLINMDDINFAIAGGDYDSYTYDISNNRTSWIDREGYVRSYSYDGQGRIQTQNEPYGQALNYTYNLISGQAETITDSLGYVKRYSYNEQGFLTKYTDAEGYITKFDKDFTGRITKKTGPVGDINGDFVIDDTDVTLAEIQGGYSITYTYTPNSDISGVTDQMGMATSMEYNNFHKPVRIT